MQMFWKVKEGREKYFYLLQTTEFTGNLPLVFSSKKTKDKVEANEGLLFVLFRN